MLIDLARRVTSAIGAQLGNMAGLVWPQFAVNSCPSAKTAAGVEAHKYRPGLGGVSFRRDPGAVRR